MSDSDDSDYQLNDYSLEAVRSLMERRLSDSASDDDDSVHSSPKHILKAVSSQDDRSPASTPSSFGPPIKATRTYSQHPATTCLQESYYSKDSGSENEGTGLATEATLLRVESDDPDWSGEDETMAAAKPTKKIPTKPTPKSAPKKKRPPTTYALFAREQFPKIKAVYPGHSFGEVGKIMGEMWKNLSEREKEVYKRKSREIAITVKAGETWSDSDSDSKPKTSLLLPGMKRIPKIKAPVKKKKTPKAKVRMLKSNKGEGRRRKSSNKSSVAATKSPSVRQIPSPIPPITTSPEDIAAHFNLLGDYLMDLGQRLGQQAEELKVSGTMPLLLDAMLCSLVSLTAICKHMPYMERAPWEPTLVNTLDNLAFIMPGS